ncbi:MAG: trypsin-like peptidase domain-containing protein [Candidatus Latescibacteria bacterium]|nr:trypsin-like peptidase domain-containing protein [Candidatus Latescibacterota bacterium]
MTERRRRIGSLLLILSGGIMLGYLWGQRPGEHEFQQAGTSPTVIRTAEAQGAHDVDGRRNAIVRAIEATEPAVVSISVTAIQEYYVSLDPFFEQFFPEFRQRVQRPISGIGSGVIVAPDGYIITNEHVIQSEKRHVREIVVNLQDGRQFEIKNIKQDVHAVPDLDIALLKIDGSNLPYARLGNSDDVIIGEWAIAIGSPFGLFIREQPTVTVGVISAAHRDFKTGEKMYRDMIQTDASINQGNSGGPLVIGSGEVIGINTFIISTDGGGSVGIGFAIPINRAKKILNEVTRHGKVRQVWAGISIHEVDPSLARYFELPKAEGVIITEIDKGSPGEKAGLKRGDLITAINGKPVRNQEEAIAPFTEARVGDVYRLMIVRDGKEREVRLRLEEKPN